MTTDDGEVAPFSDVEHVEEVDHAAAETVELRRDEHVGAAAAQRVDGLTERGALRRAMLPLTPASSAQTTVQPRAVAAAVIVVLWASRPSPQATMTRR